MLKNILLNYKHIIKNTGYLSIIEIIRFIMPFIALPYIIKTVGGNYYGTVVYAQGVVAFFTIFINFGLDISAVKDVSVSRNNKTALNNIVSSVLCIKSILFIIAFLVFLIIILSIAYFRNNQLIYFFAFLTCLSEILFPIWFYQGIEKMKYITIIRSTSILLYTISIFIFIKQSDDYIWIPLLQSSSNIIAGIISFFVLLRIEKIRLLYPGFQQIKTLFISSIPFFFSRLSVVVNNQIAKIISGVFFSMQAVAALDLAQKFGSIALLPMQMLNQATYPHIAKTKDTHFVRKFFYVNILISFTVSLFVFIIAPYAVNFFSNQELPEAIALTRIICLWIFCGGLTSYIGSPLLVSFGYPAYFNKSVILSTIILLLIYGLMYILNLFTIYNFVFALFLSELIILIYRLYYCRKYDIL